MKKKTQAPELLTRLRAWKLTHPLSEHRNNGITLSEIASLTGVSVGTVQQWIGGNRTPSDEKFTQLEQQFGRGLRAQWEKWLSTRPTTTR